MINQDEDKGLIQRLSDALEFLTQNEEQTQEEINHLNVTIKCLEESKKDINISLSVLLNLKNSNSDLFSPTKKNENNNEYNILNVEYENLVIKIEEVKSNIINFENKKNGFTNSINCLKTLNSISNIDKTFKNENTTIDNCENVNLEITDVGINILETQENERKRIARDLHDSTIQNLTNMMHKTEICTRFIDVDPSRAKLELQTMIHTIIATIHDMRNIIYNLRPMAIDDLGLIATLERYIKECIKNYEIDISLIVRNEKKDVLSVINLSLFRIVQEASNNAIKHGKATKIKIELEYDDKSISLNIYDNGIGFIQGTTTQEKNNNFSGFGLSMMRERVLLLSGEIKIESFDNNGTNILVKVPLRTLKEDC